MSCPLPTPEAHWSARGALAGERPRLLVSTDIGGHDPDDFQSLVHLLLYADLLDLEGLISSAPGPGRASDLHAVLDAYAQDLPALRTHSPAYPPVDQLRTLVRQGAIDTQSDIIPAPPSEGARLIIERARAADPQGRPLHVLAWGSLTDLAQALHAAPDIAARIRLYSIGSWNTRQDPRARDYVFQAHPSLWWIENDHGFRGMYVGGDHSGDLGNETFPLFHVRDHGALGKLFFAKKPDLKMGDTPSLLYFLRGDFTRPDTAHWGGRFIRPFADRPAYWHDDPDPALAEGPHHGARTVNIHRAAYLLDWQKRQARCLPATFTAALATR